MPYVNIGFVGNSRGTISDTNGNFRLEIPKSRQADSIYFSHLGYERQVVAVAYFQKYNPVAIVLKNSDFNLTEVVVSSPKIRLKTLKGKGMRFPGGTIAFEGFKDIERSIEIGDFVTLKKEWIAREFHIQCLKNRTEKAIVRLNFYDAADRDNVLPLTAEPIYIEIPKTEEKTDIVIPIRVYLPESTVWIGLELVDVGLDGHSLIEFPISMSGGWEKKIPILRKFRWDLVFRLK